MKQMANLIGLTGIVSAILAVLAMPLICLGFDLGAISGAMAWDSLQAALVVALSGSAGVGLVRI